LSTEIHKILKQYWGYDHFRPLQEDIIQSVLGQKDTIALLPTGGGKSICYQLPAIINPGCCLVVSPLIALMMDQVARLKEVGIEAACIHSGMHYYDVKRTLENMLYGPYKLLYVSPERLQTDLFKDFLPDLNISLIAVDEAHCISQWGHDFRPDYMKIASVRDVFTKIPVLALTATATNDVQADIIKQLDLETPQLYKQSFERNNIFYEVKYSENKTNEILSNIKTAASTIIYCRSRKQTELLAHAIEQKGIEAIAYHAGMPKENREIAQNTWMQNGKTVITATTAFGMGIDKPDVRMVLHYDSPEHLEGFYQEAGRAGRDGKPSQALLLYNSIDIKRLEDSVALQFPPEAYLRIIYQAVTEYLQIPIGAEPDQYYDFDIQDFCTKFNLDAMPASYALKLLAQEGLWTISEAVFRPATIHFITDRQTLDDISLLYPNLGYIVTNLLRLYGTIFHYPTTVRLKAIAKHLKMNLDEVEQTLLQLQSMDILTYNKPTEGPKMFFHHLRVDSKHLHIDVQRIRILRTRHKARTDNMITFLQNENQCRERILLSYFGEYPKHDCGHCDICKKKNAKTNFTEKDIKESILKAFDGTQKISIQTILSGFTDTIRPYATALIRQMADDGILKILPDGSISKADPFGK